MKRTIGVLLFLAISLPMSVYAQVETDNAHFTTETKAEALFREEAAEVLIRLMRILEGVPKKKYGLLQIENFVDKRFTSDAFIEVRNNGKVYTRHPKDYFRRLMGRYFGQNATLDSTSEIRCKKVEITPERRIVNGEVQFVFWYTQFMIDRRNNQRVGDIDETTKQVTIIFNKSIKSPSAQIKQVTIVEEN